MFSGRLGGGWAVVSRRPRGPGSASGRCGGCRGGAAAITRLRGGGRPQSSVASAAVMRCCALLGLLLGAALVGGAPSLLPGDPNYAGDGHHGEHAHGHGEHAHGHGDHHGEHAHDGQHAHSESQAHAGQAHPESHSHDGQAHPESQAHAGQAHPEPVAHAGQAHPESHSHDGQAHSESQAHAGQAHPESQAHAGQAHPESHSHDGQAHPEPQAHSGQAHQAQDAAAPAFPGQAFPGQAFPGQAFPGQAFAGQAFPGQQFPGQTRTAQAAAEPAPGSSLAQGIPDVALSYGTASGDASAVSAQTAVAAPAVPLSAPQQRPVQGARPSNPFLTGSIKLPSSSSFQVPVKPVPPPAQRPTPEPIKELNTNPLGGPAGPKGPVRASCPGPASALPCVRDEECDPYTGFLKSDGVKLPYPITKDTPTVAIGQCKLGSGVGVCCKKFPRPATTVPTTVVPLGVDYGQGLEHLKQPPTEKPPNPFLPGYSPTY